MCELASKRSKQQTINVKFVECKRKVKERKVQKENTYKYFLTNLSKKHDDDGRCC